MTPDNVPSEPYEEYYNYLIRPLIVPEQAERMAHLIEVDTAISREERETLMLLFFRRAFRHECHAIGAFQAWREQVPEPEAR